MDHLALSRDHAPHAGEINVADAERWASGIGGALLISAGLRRGSFPGLGMAILGGSLVYRAVTGHCQAYCALGINTAKPGSHAEGHRVHNGRLVKHSVTIERPAADLYRAWQDVEQLPRFMVDVESVEKSGENRARWVTKGPMGETSTWETEVINDVPDHLIAWKTLPGAHVEHAGTVRFDPATGGRGTVVTLEVNYEAPLGAAGLAIARLIGKDPDASVREDLRRFKQLMEAGELATVEGQPSGRA
ncbi:SRPBCC family protein [Tundrisphaera sp. TA3]|uniref:SRPBCC family protein n=1 Tax=Tundrisphaera sp. TA3 TaxID=3435775 RepID=UPI003EBC879C